LFLIRRFDKEFFLTTPSSLSQEILQVVTRIANSTLYLDETLKKIIQVVKNKMHMDACAIYLINQ
jgi:signal transduction protein with GAF and PtsI domain